MSRRTATVSGLGLVVVLVALVIAFRAGGSNGMDQPRDGEITSTTDDFWNAVGVDPDDVTTSPYARDNQDGIGDCSDLPEEDRWIAYRISEVPGERYNQGELWERGTSHLRDEGFDELGRYQGIHSGPLMLRAKKGEIVVFFDVSSNGYAYLEVFSGPCTIGLGTETPRAAEPIDPAPGTNTAEGSASDPNDWSFLE